MEFRRVYRGVEDTLGNPPPNIHPHSWLSRGLRFAVRETRDHATLALANALCVSAVGGNSRVDVGSIVEKASAGVMEAFGHMFPYVGRAKAEEKPRERDAERYFRMLDEMEAADKASKDATGDEKT